MTPMIPSEALADLGDERWAGIKVDRKPPSSHQEFHRIPDAKMVLWAEPPSYKTNKEIVFTLEENPNNAV